MYILISILAFGVLIATHEFGHFIAAKACGIKVNEFSVGMGPALYKKQGKETLYAIRALPIGGYCAMEGEDEDTGDPRAFTAQPAWKRLIVLVAGSFMNFITGLIIVILIFSGYSGFVGNEITGFTEGFDLEGENGLMVGDRIVSINGEKIRYAEDFSMFMARAGGENVDIIVKRNGEPIVLNDLPLKLREYEISGKKVMRYGISFKVIEGTPDTRLRYSLYSAGNFVRNVRIGLTDLVTGRAGLSDMSGPVGIVSVINEVAEQADTTKDALLNVAYICAFIAVNLAVMNMLPIPALDGGRVLFLLITTLIVHITKRKIDPKYEGYIHAAGLVILLGLMIVVMYNDIRRLI